MTNESLEHEEDEILPDEEVLPEIDDDDEAVDPEEEISSVLDDTKTGPDS